MKVNGRKYILLVLYVEDILLPDNDIDQLVETEHLLFSHFDMND